MTAHARKKGKALEKEVAEEVALWTGLTEDDIRRTRTGTDECDIQMSAEAKRRFPWFLEVKNQKTLSIPSWIRQVEEACKKHAPNLNPAVVFHIHRSAAGKKYVVMEFEKFLELVTERLRK